MRKFYVLFVSCILAGSQTFAQRELSNPLIDSKIVLEKGVALHNDGKYKDAIAQYLKVNAGDSSYSKVLHELIYSYFLDSNFTKAEMYADTALSLFPHEKLKWYAFLADIYDETDRSDLAIKYYDTILAKNPNNYLVWFNKGISLYRQKKMDEATKYFQKCILLNPYYSSAHYYLGQIAFQNGRLVEAILSFSTNLNVSPSNRYHDESIGYLKAIAEMNTTAEDYIKKYKKSKEDNFDEVQEIVASKIALNTKYKLKADLEDKIVRQIQVVLEKLQYDQNDKGFWMQYYVPLYKSIWDNDQFEPMVFNMFSNLNLKPIKDYNNKEKRKVDAFTTQAANYFNEIRESQEINYKKREAATPRYYIKNYAVTGKGVFGTNSKKEVTAAGPWEFYFESGSIRSKGVFDAEGKKKGFWEYYYDNGELKERTYFENDIATGKNESWNDNGLLSTSSTYKNDQLIGTQKTWYYSGLQASEVNHAANKKDGIAKYYSEKGYLRTVAAFKNDLQEGEQIFYYPNGQKESSVKYLNGEAEGVYNEYHEDGKIKMSGNFKQGKRTGLWKTLYNNGSPKLEETYINGELDGEYIGYFENGKKSSVQFYKKGNIDGLSKEYDDDEILFCETVYEKARLRDIKFLDKKGNVVSQTTSRRGNANISFYNAYGDKKSEGYYTKEGLAEGDFVYYHKSGKVSDRRVYKNGLINGKVTTYFADGKMSFEGNYKDDKANGYLINYYQNGQISDEGWYVNGDRQGNFYYHDLLGNLTSKLYYLNDKVQGISRYYYPGNRSDHNEYYDYGWFNKLEALDSTGKVLASSTLIKGAGKIKFGHYNGKPFFENEYEYYVKNGTQTLTNGDGSKGGKFYYKNGELDSSYVSWHPNGKVQTEGKYVNGEKEGIWKYYYASGKISEQEIYKDGKLNGKDLMYFENGDVSREYNYKEGNLQGELKYFGDNNQLILQFYYKDDILIGYGYLDKAGNLLPMNALEKEAGTVDAFYKNGTKSAHMTFVDGNTVGDRKLYYSNGKEYATSQRINGRDHGNSKTYHVNGKTMLDENYYYGEKHGSFKSYNEDGTLTSDLNYYLGDLHGEIKYYTAGKLTTTYIYYYGQLESKK